jgi:hypothetical protein
LILTALTITLPAAQEKMDTAVYKVEFNDGSDGSAKADRRFRRHCARPYFSICSRKRNEKITA